jgi:triphosphoribosyl-dephospho-CoA synthase
MLAEQALTQLSTVLSNAYKAACMEELQALKPGNVHIFADGHGMTVQDFVASADATADVISAPNLTLGQRILHSVQATQNAVGCNTNLGIILLCAPIIQACFLALKNNASYFDALGTSIHAASRASLFSRGDIEAVLSNTTAQDATDVFAAIRLANPAGLGDSAAHDVNALNVNELADCNLLTAMQFAAEKDLIAAQYANNFAAIFTLGLPLLQIDNQNQFNPAWSTTRLYLTFLASFLDSHIARKYGESAAVDVRNSATQHLTIFNKLSKPKDYLNTLLEWDNWLKVACVNPGSCADLTVACLFAVKLTNNN